MAKKKKTIDFGFTPSEYQQNIFDFVQHGVGNAVISAYAGSAKTTTAVSAMKLIPSKEKCLFIAFNKSIAAELNNRLKDYPNVTAKTFHSLGFLMIRRNYGSEIEVDEYKYRTYVKNNIASLTTIEEGEISRYQVNEYIESIITLIDFSRFYLAQTKEDVNTIAEKYDIPVSFDECDVVLKCLDWGKNNLETIDYTDMVWLPTELAMKPTGMQYDWVFCDEAQDFSIASIKLFQKCLKRGSRWVAVGDENQTINLFSGASEESFNYLRSQPNTQTFKLPITYRCDKTIVDFANNFVGDMIPRNDASEGKIIRNCKTTVLKDGDMVLARSKAPLLKVYNKLLRRGVNCYIKGQDIGLNLIKILDSVKGDELNANLKEDGVFIRLYDKLFAERNKIMEKRGLDYNDATLSTPIMEKYDTLNTLITLSEKINSKAELIERIKDIFKEESNGICLSTIHKAKGLEADNVYILCDSCMPSKMAHHKWEKLQERNLQYVAYTRPKKVLGFISEKEIPPSGSMQEPMEIINELAYIENKVCQILGKEPTEKMENAEMALFNLKTKTEVVDIHQNDNMKVINSTINTNDCTAIKTNKSTSLLDDLEILL